MFFTIPFFVDTFLIYAKILIMKKCLKTPTKLKGKRKHGYRARKATAGGRKVLQRRMKKGRQKLTV